MDSYSREDSAVILHLFIYCHTDMKPRKQQILGEKIQLRRLSSFSLQLNVLPLAGRRDTGGTAAFGSFR